MKTILNLLKLAYWDLHNVQVRFAIICWLTANVPGQLGFKLRQLLWPRYFKAAGQELCFHKGATIINPQKLIMKDFARMGAYNYIQAGGGVEIGEYSMFGPYVKVWSQNHKFDDPDTWIQEQGYDVKPVKIGKYVWVGAGAFIMPGVEIGDHCIISAGSVVGAKKYPPNLILAGNPARKVGNRPISSSELFEE